MRRTITIDYWLFLLFLFTMLVGLLFVGVLSVSAQDPYPPPTPEPIYGLNPVWLWSECGGTRPHVTIGYFNPSASVLPFQSTFPGHLYVHGDGYWASYILAYLGPSSSPYGILYRWVGWYVIPPISDYVVDATVVTEGGLNEQSVLPGGLVTGCVIVRNIYLPLLLN